MKAKDDYLTTASAFADFVEQISPTMWGKPGLGVWDVRSLTGHASRALITVITYLDRPCDAVAIPSAAEYYVAAKRLKNADAKAVERRGRDAGEALGGDPAQSVGKLVNDVRDKLGNVEGDPVIETIGGGMRVSSYLPTRTFELVVHGMDLARATGLTYAVPDEIMRSMAELAVDVGAAIGNAGAILLALTGRASLPEDFSVV